MHSVLIRAGLGFPIESYGIKIKRWSFDRYRILPFANVDVRSAVYLSKTSPYIQVNKATFHGLRINTESRHVITRTLFPLLLFLHR